MRRERPTRAPEREDTHVRHQTNHGLRSPRGRLRSSSRHIHHLRRFRKPVVRSFSLPTGTGARSVSVVSPSDGAEEASRVATLAEPAGIAVDMRTGDLGAPPPDWRSIPWSRWAACETSGIGDKFRVVRDYERLVWPGMSRSYARL